MNSVAARTGSIILFLHATGHTLGGVIFYRAHTPQEASVIAQMQTYLLPPIEGSIRTLWDFYYGWGLAVGVMGYAFAIQAWLLARQIRQGNLTGSGMLLVLAFVCFAQAYLSWRYFFLLPLALTAVAGAGFVWQWYLLRNQPRAAAA